MSRDLKIFEFNDRTTFDSSESEESRAEMTDLKEGDRVTIHVDDQNVIHRIEIEPGNDESQP